MRSTFKTNALKGFKWSFINKTMMQILQFVFSVILARILSPDDFGLFAMITVFSNLGMLFKDFGFGHALIYKTDASKHEFDSVFMLNMFFGLFLSVLFFVLAPVISGFYEEPPLNNLIKVFSIVFFIQSFGLVNLTEIKKKLDFRKLAVIENTSLLVSSVIAITLALLNFGVWSLVARTILNMTIRTIIVYFLSDYRPRFRFNLMDIKNLWKFSINISANGFLTYWMSNLDNLMIGKMLGQQSLGVYNMAYRIMLLPIQNISNIIKDVLFPSFSSIKNDIKIIRPVYLKVVQSIALFTFPLLAGLACLSDLFVLTVLGEKWASMIPVLTLLALIAIPRSILTINGTIYLNIGRPDVPLKINLISLPLYAAGFYVGLKLNGMIGLVYAYIIIFAVLMIPTYYFSAKHISLRFIDFLKSLFPVIMNTTIMSIVLIILKRYVFTTQTILSFIVLILIGILSYGIILFLQRDKIGVIDIIKEQILINNSKKKKKE